MTHLKALGFKFIAVLGVLFLVASFTISFYDILAMSILFTLVGYFLGDLVVLPFTGNVIAVIVDAAFVWVAGLLLYHSYTHLAPILSAVGIAIVEWFFHSYVQGRVTAK